MRMNEPNDVVSFLKHENAAELAADTYIWISLVGKLSGWILEKLQKKIDFLIKKMIENGFFEENGQKVEKNIEKK